MRADAEAVGAEERRLERRLPVHRCAFLDLAGDETTLAEAQTLSVEGAEPFVTEVGKVPTLHKVR